MIQTNVSIGQDYKLSPAVIEPIKVDTLKVHGKNYSITHYHTISREVEKKNFLYSNDEIFSNDLNDFSRLIFKSSKDSFNIASVPLTHIEFLKDQGLILGLSKISTNSYHIVLYQTNGKLLSKRSLDLFELKLNKEDLKYFIKNHPEVKDCISQGTIITKTDSFYYIELSRCILKKIGKDSIINNKAFTSNHFFPFMDVIISETGFSFQKYYNSYSKVKPFNSLIMVGGRPQVLILNSEDGKKVKIPLLSNCNIVDEIK